jgi:hypothetical protein
MPVGLTALAIGAGALAAGSGIAQGVGQARAGKKMMLSEAEQRELDELKKRRRTGELGLEERERGALEQQFLASQAAQRREQQAQGLQEAAAAGLQRGVSGRDIFLRQMAQEQAGLESRQQQNIAVQQAEQAERIREEARIDALTAKQQQAEAMRAQGIAQAVSGGLAGAGQVAQMGFQYQSDLAMQEAALKGMSDEELLRRLDKPTPSYYTNRLGRV